MGAAQRLRRRETVKPIDTVLSASAHNPNIRGMSDSFQQSGPNLPMD